MVRAAQPAYVVSVRRLTKLLIGLATTAVILGSAGASTSRGSFTISASSTRMRIGDYRVDKNSTYAGAVAALGQSSSCRVVHRDPSHALAAWRPLGLVVELSTYGSVPRGKTGCIAPRSIHVHTIRAVDHRWRTLRGLRVGDAVPRLRHLYPSAKPARGLAGWYEPGYWLATRRVGGYEGIGGLKPFAPVLVAETKHGRVSAFVLVVGAEGD
jgi:hypothetical protein